MKIIAATITEQNLIITPSVISVAESVGLYALKISYDEEWDEVDTKIVTFTAPTGISIAIQDLGAEEGVVIPWEVLQNPGKVSVGVVGYVGTAIKITTTGLYKRNTFVVQPEAFGLQDAMTPTPDIYQTLIQTIDEINQSITDLQTNIDTVADDVAEVAEDVGDLGSLETENKDNLVDAINEVLEGAGGGAVSSVNGKTGVVVLKTSDIENDSGYQTQIQMIEALNDALDAFDETVDSKIATEATAREAADTNLQGQIDAISASSDVNDIVGTYAELQAYDTSTLSDNDIIKVLQDESRNDETTYYRWSTTTQTFTLIGEEGPYYTKSAADAKFQDKLTAGANINIGPNNEISATDTTYTAGAGLVLTGTVFSGDVNYRALNGASAPTTATEAKYVGQLYYDTTAGDMYYCSVITPQGTTPETYTYTWVQLGGGSSVNVVQTIGTSTTDVMSQDAVTNELYDADGNIRLGNSSTASSSPGPNIIIGKGDSVLAGNYGKIIIGDNITDTNAQTNTIEIGSAAKSASGGNIAIGQNANSGSGSESVAFGENSSCGGGSRATAIGARATAGRGGVALGAYSRTTRNGEVNIGSTNTSWGYNSTNYRVLGGVHAAVDDHDAVNLEQMNSRIVGSGTAAPTTSTAGEVGALYAYVENGTGHLAICTAADASTSTYTWQTLI